MVVAINSVSGGSDLERVGSALRLQTNCAQVVIRRPTSATVVKRWAGSTADSADVSCAGAPSQVVYVRFISHTRLLAAMAESAPSGGYCLVGDAIVLDRLVRVPSTVLSDMCQSLGGSLGNGGA